MADKKRRTIDEAKIEAILSRGNTAEIKNAKDGGVLILEVNRTVIGDQPDVEEATDR